MSVRPPAFALLALLLVAAAAMAWLAVQQLDDVYILYRYARNVANGAGYVFNPGERVEGVTCFLWTLVLAPFSALGLSLPRVGPMLTAVCGLALIVLTAQIHGENARRRALALQDLLPALLLASSPALLYWSVGALETVPFALLITLALRDHGREMRTPSRWPRSALWLGLASLTRPETVLVVAALGLDRLLCARAEQRLMAGLRESLRWCAIIAALLLPFLLFRHAYFGEWLPNTYYAKLGAPLAARAHAGLHYLQRWALSIIPHPGVGAWRLMSLAWIMLILLGVLVLDALRRAQLRAAALLVSSLVAACLFEGGDWMTLHRFVVPALPALALLGGAALQRLAAYGRSATAFAVALILILLTGSALYAKHERDCGSCLAIVGDGYRHAHASIGSYIAAHGARGDVVALMDVGLIGWIAAEQRIVDISGLTDRLIAHAPGRFLDKRYPASYVLNMKPRYIVLVAGFGPDQRIARDPDFIAHYSFKFAVNHRYNWLPPSEYYLQLFERRPN